MEFARQERWLILGASRGLGRAFCEEAARTYGEKLHLNLVARNKERLAQVAQRLQSHKTPSSIVAADLADRPLQHQLVDLSRQPFDRIFFFAAGGPYGNFASKQWKDHQWALNVSLIFPMEFSHLTMQSKFCRQWNYIGSSVAEAKADPLASSYAAAKHGLKGWITSVAEESGHDVRLFSPGYIDTDLLPPNAKARQLGQPWKAHAVAQKLLEWIVQPAGATPHKILDLYETSSPHSHKNL